MSGLPDSGNVVENEHVCVKEQYAFKGFWKEIGKQEWERRFSDKPGRPRKHTCHRGARDDRLRFHEGRDGP